MLSAAQIDDGDGNDSAGAGNDSCVHIENPTGCEHIG
jgi:hypothetical protein